MTAASLYQLKPGFQGLLRPAVARLAALGITANQVTISSALASVAVGAYLSVWQKGWISLPVFLVLRMAANAVDGMLAREYRQESKLGAILNELGDVLSDAALVFPIGRLPGWNPAWVGAAILLAIFTEMSGLRGFPVSSARRNDGPFGKSDRALALGTLGAWLALGWPIASWAPAALSLAWIALCCFTIVNRTRKAFA